MAKAARKTNKAPKASPNIVELPDETVALLTKHFPSHTLVGAIALLIQNFDSVMEEDGEEGDPLVQPSDDEAPPVPSDDLRRRIEEFEAQQEKSGIIQDVTVHEGVGSPPHDPDGLVSAEYILRSELAVLQGVALPMPDKLLLIIREELSKVPEDLWNGPVVIAKIAARFGASK